MEIVRAVGISVSKILDRQIIDGRIPSVVASKTPSVYPSVIVVFCCNYFRTLCEIPTDGGPSVWLSVIVVFCCNYFRTLYDIPMDGGPSVLMSVIVAFQDRRESVGMVVGNYRISSNYFQTLCEMPTDVNS